LFGAREEKLVQKMKRHVSVADFIFLFLNCGQTVYEPTANCWLSSHTQMIPSFTHKLLLYRSVKGINITHDFPHQMKRLYQHRSWKEFILLLLCQPNKTKRNTLFLFGGRAPFRLAESYGFNILDKSTFPCLVRLTSVIALYR
jgi:hypothetical protein